MNVNVQSIEISISFYSILHQTWVRNNWNYVGMFFASIVFFSSILSLVVALDVFYEVIELCVWLLTSWLSSFM